MVLPHAGSCHCCHRPGALGCTGICGLCNFTPECDHCGNVSMREDLYADVPLTEREYKVIQQLLWDLDRQHLDPPLTEFELRKLRLKFDDENERVREG